MFQFEKRIKNGESGQSLVEAAFGLAILLFMLAGLIDLGRIYFTYVALEDAAGEAALYLSIYPECPGDGTDTGTTSGKPVDNNGFSHSNPYTANCNPPNNAVWRAKQAGGGIVDWSTPGTAVVAVRSTIAGVGERVDVSITYPYRFIMPFIPDIAGATTINLVAKTSQTIVTE